ncbi:phage replisome organizer N-terminal domain-containing protein [Culicoidibacter larvae]|uniref:phage replisome organizer N-terminal domain-containing protein n=1 Tax=Culicoidibacter larvae TaxID=2579976 RepID=UPI001484C968|nr:phage replisome organizer N-terminal domain-containing protein [Culicoidibacter larvae]
MANKYYWLRLDKGFFKRHDLKLIRKMPQGDSIALFYMMLLTESIDHDGNLRFDDLIPYDAEMLAILFEYETAFVEMAIKLLEKFNMIEILEDETIYMSKIANMIGSETSAAARVRKHRENQKTLQCNTSVTPSNKLKQICNTEKEIDIEKEIKKDIDNTLVINDNVQKSTHIDFSEQFKNDFNNICTELSKVQKITAGRKTAIKSLMKLLGITSEHEYTNIAVPFLKTISNSGFLNGNNKNGWKATFDWITKQANAVKIIEGNYNKKQSELTTRDLDLEVEINVF